MSGPSRWDRALSLALARGVAPDAFWKLSLLEWRALSTPFAPAALSRPELETLMQIYPDGEQR